MASFKKDKGRILDEFIAVTGHHRKYGIRLLEQTDRDGEKLPGVEGQHIHDEAAREAVVTIWEAAGRIRGKRLKAALFLLVESMERHGHLASDPVVGERPLSASAAALNRLLKPIRPTAVDVQTLAGTGCAASVPEGHYESRLSIENWIFYGRRRRKPLPKMMHPARHQTLPISDFRVSRSLDDGSAGVGDLWDAFTILDHGAGALLQQAVIYGFRKQVISWISRASSRFATSHSDVRSG